MPTIPDSVPAESGNVDQQWCEAPYPPVDRDVINLDATLGE
jgi:hypothetical protein